MNQQPNPAPSSATPKTFLGHRFRIVDRDPDLLILPDKRTPALDPERPDAQGFRPSRFAAALLRHYDTDAHAAPYLTDAEIPGGLQPRRKLGDLEDCYTGSVWLDVDTERHGWCAEQRADVGAVLEALEVERAAIESAVEAGLPRPRALYATRGGWRLVYVLAEPIPTAEMRPFIRGLIQRAKDAGLAGVDEACSDPTRIMRLPNVVRDGVATWTEPYATGVEFCGSTLDVRKEIEPIGEREQSREPVAVEPADLDAIAPAVLGRMRTRAGTELYGACYHIVHAPESTGHAAILGRSNWIGNIVGAGLLDADKAQASLFEAVESRYADRGSNKIHGGKATVIDGLRNGARQPLDLAGWIAEDLPPLRLVKTPADPRIEEPIDHAPTVGWNLTGPQGAPLNLKENWGVALQKLGVRVWRDLFSGRDMVDGLPDRDLGSELTDDTERRVRFLVEQQIANGEPSVAKFREFLSHECLVNRRHPVREYLDSLKWDGVPRLASLLSVYFGAEDSEIHREFGRLHLCAAVKRVLEPGAKYDEVLVLEGAQGVNKSSAIQALCPRADWFVDDLALGVDSKVTIEQTRGKLFIELAELTGMSRKDVEKVKAQVSRQSDRARLSYDRRAADIPRQFVLWGSTNDGEYLRDQTGNRRFWPVRIGQIDLAAIRRDRDQLWAEAVHHVHNGASIRLDPRFYSIAAAAQAERTVEDPIGDKLAAALAALDDVEHVRVPSDDLWSVVGVGVAGSDLETRSRMADKFGAACQRLGFVAKRIRANGGRTYYRVRGDVYKAQTFRWKAGRFVLDTSADPSPEVAKLANAKALGLYRPK